MRILSCHILGFGKFISRAFDFSAPLTVFKEENGWGKTTLADFIECMLYGLDGGRSKSVSENMRLKYEPLFGGGFGGSMLFEWQGKKYRVERTFGKTPSADTARVYDNNNSLCYEFGERCERLGETVLGVNRESLRKSAYIAQGEKDAFGLSEDLKGRLIALFTVADGGEGAQSALSRLENADRALRAKRKPAKGKLDELDERLSYLAREKDECERAKVRAESLRAEIAREREKLDAVKKESEKYAQQMENASRKLEYEARDIAYKEVRVRAEQAQAKKADLEVFFRGVAPQTVNIDGVKQASAEFYALEEEIALLQNNLFDCQTKRTEKESLLSQLDAQKKVVQAHALLLGGANEIKEEKKRVKATKISKKRTWLFVLALALFLVGATQITLVPALGYPLFIGGGLVLVWYLVSLINSVKGMGKVKQVGRSASAGYDEAKNACAEIELRLAQYGDDLEKTYTDLQTQIQAKRARKDALKDGIERFFGNFAFGEIYDYQSAVAKLEENIALYAEYTKLCADAQADLENIQPTSEKIVVGEDMLTLKMRLGQLQSDRETLETAIARLFATLETEDARAREWESLDGEEKLLISEKQRLEKRLVAIRYAKEFLLKARENTASRYLNPVVNRCREYAKILRFSGESEKMRFTTDGVPVMEENGRMVAVDYYSTGLKELLGFCVRLAVYETVFDKDAPPLILDDPFVNLDDDKTARAKGLVVELSKTRQIIYFTCKSERAF